jgi:hypothetical protein
MQEAHRITHPAAIDPESIKGWAVDADPENDPTYPMQVRTDDSHKGYTWERPDQQPEDVETLHSNERPNLTSVFGTSTPPSGLSGMIRRRAFDYSENSYAHWLPLMLADRINMVEGVFSDLATGRIPNFFAENGMGAEWKYNKTRVITKVAIGAATVGLIVWLVKRPRTEEV